MGRATRWLKALLSGGGTSSGKKKNKAYTSSGAPSEPAGSVAGGGAKDNKGGGWGFARSFRDKDASAAASVCGAEPAGVRREPLGGKGSSCREVPSGAARSRRTPHDPSCCSLSSSSSASAKPSAGGCAAGRVAAVVPDEEEQSKRAIAVAAATAAAAEAAVAAAQAAAAVVRLTSRAGPYGPASSSSAARRSEDWAALKIQSAFRGYLARRALKALKGLVKIQALVRGHIVRKQAAETLRCMQALVRVQARARAGRSLGDNKQQQSSSSSRDSRLHHRHHHQHLGQGYYGTHYESKDAAMAVNSLKPCTGRSNTLNRNGSRSKSAACAVDPTVLQSPGWNWLDRWMEERYWDSRETLSRSGGGQTTDDERNEKILEVDAGSRPIMLSNAAGRPARNGHGHHYSASEQRTRGYSTLLGGDSPSKDSTVVQQQSIPSPSSVDQHPHHHHHILGNLRCFPLEHGVEYSDSPQFFSASSRHGAGSRPGPFTPSRSECSRSYFSGYADYPNYMSNTESSKAKLRSHSAPKQRPDYDKSYSLKRNHLHNQQQYQNPAAPGVGTSGPLSSSSSMQLKFAGKAYPGSGRLDRMGMPIKILS